MDLCKSGHMKTTVDLPETTFRKAKALAAARGVTLKRFFTEALEAQIRRCRVVGQVDDAEPPWMAGFGGLADLSDEKRRILDVISREFGRIESEDQL